MNVSAIFWYDVNVTEFPLWFLAHLSWRVNFFAEVYAVCLWASLIEDVWRFKLIQIMTPMYNKRNSNENDVKLILNEAIIQIFTNITYKGF